MPTYASNKGGGSFIPCPAGQQRLVCCDIVDHGWVQGSYGGKPKLQPKITIRFQSEHTMADGKPYIIGRRFTTSLKENSALRPFLNAWRGRPLTEDECERFDLDKLMGVSAYANVIHANKPRGLFAEISSIMPLPKGMDRLTVSADYVLVRLQTPKPPADAEGAPPAREPGEEEDADAPAF